MSHILDVLSYDPDKTSLESFDQHISDTFKECSFKQQIFEKKESLKQENCYIKTN